MWFLFLHKFIVSLSNYSYMISNNENYIKIQIVINYMSGSDHAEQ